MQPSGLCRTDSSKTIDYPSPSVAGLSRFGCLWKRQSCFDSEKSERAWSGLDECLPNVWSKHLSFLVARGSEIKCDALIANIRNASTFADRWKPPKWKSNQCKVLSTITKGMRRGLIYITLINRCRDFTNDDSSRMAYFCAQIFFFERNYVRSSHRIASTETSNIDTITFSRFVVLHSRTKSVFHASIHESTSLSTDNEDTSLARGLVRVKV